MRMLSLGIFNRLTDWKKSVNVWGTTGLLPDLLYASNKTPAG